MEWVDDPAVADDYSTYGPDVTTLPAGVVRDDQSPTGYSDVDGNAVDAAGNPADAAGAPATDTSNYGNEGKNYPRPGSTQGPGGSPVNASMAQPSDSITAAFNKMFGTSLTGAQLGKLAAVAGGGIAGLMGANTPNVTKVGYQGGLPELQANRNMMTAPPAGHRPGSGGINWGGDVTYSPKGTPAAAVAGSYTPSPADIAAKGLPAIAAASGLATGRPMEQFPGPDTTMPIEAIPDETGDTTPSWNIIDETGDTTPSWVIDDETGEPKDQTPEQYVDPMQAELEAFAKTYRAPTAPAPVVQSGGDFDGGATTSANNFGWGQNPRFRSGSGEQQGGMAHGGIAALAHGGRYLQGSTDGMADKLRTSIDGKQPAALSHGEFVVPADVVSHLGNGNSDAGAKKLYSMMDKIRQARTGTKKQGKQINPDKFMPGGLAAAYAAGGSVSNFVDGGTVPTGTTGVDQTVASWTGNYAPNLLAQGQALASAPYQQYTGQLTAGPSDLQNKAFTAGANLQTPAALGTAATTAGGIATKAQGLTYTPQTTDFSTDAANKYMNPYLQASLNPQIDEARRQSQIDQQLNAANAIKSGSFGGGAGDIMNRASQRDLGSKLAGIVGSGYNTAYDKAQAQFNADQNRKVLENQFGATYANQGLQTALQAAQAQGTIGTQQNQANIANTQEQANLGATQRGIESEGLSADQKAFNEARDNPFKMLTWQQSLLNGMPISATNYTAAQPNALQGAAGGAKTVNDLLAALGIK